MDVSNWTSSTSPGMSTSPKKKDQITYSQHQDEVETTETLFTTTNQDLLKETLTKLRLLANEIEADRWKYE